MFNTVCISIPSTIHLREVMRYMIRSLIENLRFQIYQEYYQTPLLNNPLFKNIHNVYWGIFSIPKFMNQLKFIPYKNIPEYVLCRNKFTVPTVFLYIYSVSASQEETAIHLYHI